MFKKLQVAEPGEQNKDRKEFHWFWSLYSCMIL